MSHYLLLSNFVYITAIVYACHTSLLCNNIIIYTRARYPERAMQDMYIYIHVHVYADVGAQKCLALYYNIIIIIQQLNYYTSIV